MQTVAMLFAIAVSAVVLIAIFLLRRGRLMREVSLFAAGDLASSGSQHARSDGEDGGGSDGGGD